MKPREQERTRRPYARDSMRELVRRLFLLISAAGGVWGAFYVVNFLALRANNGEAFHLTRECEPLLIPVGLIGAVVGACVGGILFPVRH